MFFGKKNLNIKAENNDLNEFKRLWNDELLKNVDSRNFTKAYHFANRKRSIKEYCMKNYFDFTSESSPRFKEACDAFNEGDILWTHMLIRQFASLPGHANRLKHLTNKRRSFLSVKRSESVVTRGSVRSFVHNLMKNFEKPAESFIEAALSDVKLYSKYFEEGNYKSAYKIAALTDKSGDYVPNIKKYLYYAAKRPITKENLRQTNEYFEYVGRYYNFKRKKKDGGHVVVHDIDYIIALIIFYKNGGNVLKDDIIKKLHRTVKVYCSENKFTPICMLADYLYQIGETQMEQITLKLLVYYGIAINEKYRKRYSCLELMSKNSNKFIFRHNPHEPLECIRYDHNSIDIYELLKSCIEKKKANSWCIAIKDTFKSYEIASKYYFDDKLLSMLETIMDNEFGEFVLEYSMRTYFDSDESSNAKHSMVIITSGKNQYADFPKIAIMIKLEPITKKLLNVHYATLYLPEESYTEEEIRNDAQYINKILSDSMDSRFSTFSNVIENLTWNALDELLGK